MSKPSKPQCFQDLILTLQDYWAGQGCLILQPYDMEMGAGTFHTATTLRALGPKPWYAAYVQPSRRPKDGRYGENPDAAAALLPVPGDPEAVADRHPRALSRLARGDRHRHRPARHPLRRGRLGEPDARRLGARLGSLVRRHGDHPVHLLPAGRRHRGRPGGGRDHLRARAARHVPVRQEDGLRAAVQLADSDVPLLYGDVFLQNEQEQSAYNFEHRRHRHAVPPLRRRGEGVRAA